MPGENKEMIPENRVWINPVLLVIYRYYVGLIVIGRMQTAVKPNYQDNPCYQEDKQEESAEEIVNG